MTTRFIAQRALTGEFLSYSVPLKTDGGQHELSASGSLTGTCSPDTGALRAVDGRLLLEEWGTYLYEEVDGVIRWGGIVITSSFQGAAWTIECAGFATYPTGTPWTGDLERAGIDPLEVVRLIWADVQSKPDSDLGMVVVGPTKSATTLGTAEEPYELRWWNTTDCGREISNLATQAPFDWTERHTWDGDEIKHEFVIGYPRLGTRREDLSFVQGVNVTANLEPSIGGDDFANGIIGLGAGEGAGAVRRETSIHDGRLRRTKVVPAKDVTQTDRLDAIIADELRRSQSTRQIESITIVDHPNAPIGSWSLGDDILVTGVVPWLGKIELWHRITGWSPTGPSRGTISLAPTDSFTYGG